jgi:hypothetical protein
MLSKEDQNTYVPLLPVGHAHQAHLRREMELEFERRHTGLLAKLAALEERKGARASGAGA